ncbi:hypothetical protein QQP08_005013 [Theobroma cacao]|nr:hypothetical protein QQP08_005013 [Theobroma cacao]
MNIPCPSEICRMIRKNTMVHAQKKSRRRPMLVYAVLGSTNHARLLALIFSALVRRKT